MVALDDQGLLAVGEFLIHDRGPLGKRAEFGAWNAADVPLVFLTHIDKTGRATGLKQIPELEH